MRPLVVAALVLAGAVGLLLAPMLAPPDRVPLSEAPGQPGPVRVEGQVATLREDGGRVHLLLRNGSKVWLTIHGPVDVDPGDRIQATTRPQGDVLVADPGDVAVLSHGVDLLRHVARAPQDRTGNLTVEATVDKVYETVAYLRDRGHRLRVVEGEAPWPPDVDRGRRVHAIGRLTYEATSLRYVLHLDGIDRV